MLQIVLSVNIVFVFKGPIMSVRRLRHICVNAMLHHPDLVLLTGDFYTTEAHGQPFALQEAFEPLLPMANRVFACIGNKHKK